MLPAVLSAENVAARRLSVVGRFAVTGPVTCHGRASVTCAKCATARALSSRVRSDFPVRHVRDAASALPHARRRHRSGSPGWQGGKVSRLPAKASSPSARVSARSEGAPALRITFALFRSRPSRATLERMGDVAKRRATYQDVLDAPPNRVAEVLFGVLHTFPRPGVRHARAGSLTPRDPDPLSRTV